MKRVYIKPQSDVIYLKMSSSILLETSLLYDTSGTPITDPEEIH